MNGDSVAPKKMNVFQKIIGIYTSPTETFTSINEKPTWLIPFIIIVIVAIASQLLVLDIALKDRMAMLEAQNYSAEQLQAAQAQMNSPLRYIGFVFVPIVILIMWSIYSGVLLFTGNTIMGGQAKFKNLFAMVSWASLIGVLQAIVNTFLVLSKGTSRGVTTSLAVLMPQPGLGDQPTLLYRFLQHFDLFTVWQMVLWIFGTAVIFKFTTKKSATMVLIIWGVYIVIATLLGHFVGGIFRPR